ADIDQEVAVGLFGGQNRRPEEVDGEVGQRDGIGNLESLVDREESEIDLHKREQFGRYLPSHVEHGQRRQETFCDVGCLQLVQEIAGQFIEADPAVVIGVE